jgi:hypothetical protein
MENQARGFLSDEGCSISCSAMRSMQDRSPQRHFARHLQQPEAQAAAGIRDGTYFRN